MLTLEDIINRDINISDLLKQTSVNLEKILDKYITNSNEYYGADLRKVKLAQSEGHLVDEALELALVIRGHIPLAWETGIDKHYILLFNNIMKIGYILGLQSFSSDFDKDYHWSMVFFMPKNRNLAILFIHRKDVTDRTFNRFIESYVLGYSEKQIKDFLKISQSEYTAYKEQLINKSSQLSQFKQSGGYSCKTRKQSRKRSRRKTRKRSRKRSRRKTLRKTRKRSRRKIHKQSRRKTRNRFKKRK